MEQHPKPIFYDERGRRWPVILRTWAALALVLSVLGAVFIFSVLVMNTTHMVLPPDSLHPDLERGPAVLNPAQVRKTFALNRRLARDVAALRRHIRETSRPKAIVPRARARDRQPMSIVAGFYVNWDPTSFASLRNNVDALTHLMPEWMHLGPGGASFQSEESKKVIDFAALHKLPVMPLFNNMAEEQWQPDRLHALLTNEPAQDKLIASIVAYLEKYQFRGLNLDFEMAPAQDRDLMTAFVEKLADALHAKDLVLSQDVPIDDDAYDVQALGEVNDFIVPMLYDEHESSGAAGPVASQGWYEEKAKEIYALVPPSKVLLGVGAYGYDWVAGKGATSVTYETAVINARDNESKIQFDPGSLNPHYSYEDANGKHSVWFLDGVTLYNELESQRKDKPLGAALWYMGSEDPSIWSFFHRSLLKQPQPATSLENISFKEEVDFQGTGEVLDIISTPKDGRRTLDVQNGVIRDEAYREYPTPYGIRLAGQQKGSIALSFDDGPDPTWTPKILDVLQKYHVPATFFVQGKMAEQNPGLIKREYAEGHEIGNHSYTHPDLAEVGPLRVRLELDATQRAIETLTGHSTRMFRPPYTVDTTPDKAAQIAPLVEAESLGYVIVGANVDPNDWARPGVHAILWGAKHVKTEVPDVTEIDGVFPTLQLAKQPGADAANIILLHDAGGDRSETVAALPLIIEGLQKRGYTFTTVSGLLGYKDRDSLMPPVTGRQAMLVGADRVWFDMVYGGFTVLQYLFYVALFLGISRVLFTMVFAVKQTREAKRERFDPSFQPSVSVVIAAYNEAKVIERTVRTLLESHTPDLEVIVVDDGSVDNTSEVVCSAFGDEARVHLITKPNGGKASALNAGLAQAQGEIIIGLDADTMFTPETIPLLIRHFDDPPVAAVAGNVKVGNRINLWTLWQSLEYITSQNFDRRAYSALNCITVVPGAVGAWRRRVVEEAGGYLADTLAEDTDLTLRVRRLGYRIETENEALAFTEAPDTLKALAKQRFRWAFGTLQCLWKHRDTLYRKQYGTLGSIALPTLWLFQMGFQAISPIVDLTILYAALAGNLGTVLFYYGVFFLVDLAGAVVAVVLDREDWRLLLWMFWQRFAYRQLMYYVIFRSVLAAVKGGRMGWGKLERKGTATVGAR